VANARFFGAGPIYRTRPRQKGSGTGALAVLPCCHRRACNGGDLALLLGIDKFMSECRALTNLVGNGVACVVISRSENELDVDKLHEAMANPIELGEEMETSPA
jgi:Na+/H+-dicarboxylate symporter